MRSILRIAVLVILLGAFFPVKGFAQSAPSLSPGVRPILQGGQGAVEIYDVTALYWNPAGLALWRGQRGLFSFSGPFHLEYAGLAGFFPVIGTVALAAGREPSPANAELFAAGWGRSFFNRIHTGISLTNHPDGRSSYTALGVGAIWKPLDLAAPQEQSIYPRWLIPLSIGLSLRNISLNPAVGKKLQGSIAASYAFSRQGPKVSYGYSWQGDHGLQHIGASFAPTTWLSLMAGMEDFRDDGLAAGVSVAVENIVLDAGYDFGRESGKLALSFVIGSSPQQRSRLAQENAARMLQEGDQRAALHYAQHALAYDPSSARAREIIRSLSGRVRIQDSAIDSLLQQAQRNLQKKWFISAAASYLKVLRIDSENRYARLALQTIAPKVAQQGERWYQNGLQFYEKGDLKHAREIFQSVHLVLPDHVGARDHLDRIEEQVAQKVQESYFAGLGYFTQKKYFEAEECFRKALSLNPDFHEAAEYIERILEERKQSQQVVDHLLLEARRREEASDWVKALQLYRQILEIEPNFSYARKREQEVQGRVTTYINQQFVKAEAAYVSGDLDTARKLFHAILDIRPSHAGAKRYLDELQPAPADKAQNFLDLSRRYFAQGRWDAALAVIDSLIRYTPDSAEALTLRRKCYANLPVERLIQIGRAGYLSGHYTEALEAISEALKKEPGRRDAVDLAAQCESRIARLVDEYFNRGLNYYTTEKYRAAIAEWNRALLINPDHRGSIEYKRRAQERLDALKQLP